MTINLDTAWRVSRVNATAISGLQKITWMTTWIPFRPGNRTRFVFLGRSSVNWASNTFSREKERLQRWCQIRIVISTTLNSSCNISSSCIRSSNWGKWARRKLPATVVICHNITIKAELPLQMVTRWSSQPLLRSQRCRSSNKTSRSKSNRCSIRLGTTSTLVDESIGAPTTWPASSPRIWTRIERVLHHLGGEAKANIRWPIMRTRKWITWTTCSH